MSTSFALAIKRLHGAGIVRAAARHNLREIAAELGADSHIDTKRIADNVILRGPATGDEVAELAGVLLQAAGIGKLRKNCVQALELLFTLPAGTAVDLVQYFEEATAWAAHYFAVPVLSSVIHRDEGAPHAHVLLLPLLDGHMVGSDLHGGRAQLWAMQKDFHEAVGVRHGLARQAPQKRLSAPVRGAAMDLARATLMTNSALTDSVIEALLAPHAKDPAPLLLALGITMPTPPASGQGSFADIMTKPVALESRNPIGNASRPSAPASADLALEESQPYPCVGIASATNQILSQPAGMPTASAAPAEAQHPPISSMPATDTASPAPATGPQLERSTTDQPADEVQNQHPTARRLLNFKDTPSVTAASATMGGLLSFEGISAAGELGVVSAPPSATGQRQVARTVQNFLHTPLAVSARPSTSAAVRPPVTPIMRADAGYEGSQNFLDTPLVATANPGTDQAVSTSPSPRPSAEAKHPVASSGESTATASPLQVDHQDAPAATDQAVPRPDIDAGLATLIAPAKSAPAKRKGEPTAIGPATPVSTAPKRPRKASTSRTASAPSTSRPAPAARRNPAYVAAAMVLVVDTVPHFPAVAATPHQPAGADASEIYERCPPSPVSTSTAPGARSRTAATGTAKLAMRSKPKLTAANRRTSTTAASRKVSAQYQAGAAAVGAMGLYAVQPPGGASRQNIRDGQQPANHTAGQRRAPEDFGTQGRADDVQLLDAIPAAGATICRDHQSAVVEGNTEAGKSRIGIDVDQRDDIRRLGVVVLVESNVPSCAVPASSFSEHSEIREIPGFTGTSATPPYGRARAAGLTSARLARAPPS